VELRASRLRGGYKTDIDELALGVAVLHIWLGFEGELVFLFFGIRGVYCPAASSCDISHFLISYPYP
jgi:hypothetical protein